MKVILSIKPEFVDKIFKGEKKFEYRKSMFKNKSIDTVLVYSTLPVGLIVGEFKIISIIKGDPAFVWQKTKKQSGISEDFYQSYFENRKNAVAIQIGVTKLYEVPINPYEEFEQFTAPQSFKYFK